ncbi:MAG TPA: acetyl-CoA C-acetyltransferase [Vicinamibacterales bacterium]|nr:acetyl-CoA C-acetyltransferase [Acidobacteriota bacterium]HQX83217.1 acetyl-CoA C-acetyltransferase [Vicinamibacterales bacterium]
MTDVLILGGARTPMTDYTGSLKDISALELGAIAARGAFEKTGVKPEWIEHAVVGNVLQTSSDAIYGARHVALKAGVPIEVPALTVNRLCGSGIQAAVSGAQLIQLGEAGMVLTGGIESMSQAPHIMRGLRTGLRLGQGKLEDYLYEALLDPYCGLFMAQTAEKCASKYGISREDQDAYAIRSQKAAAAAWAEGRFAAEITPVEIKSRKGVTVIDKDDHLRPDTTMEGLAKLPAAFSKEGTVTAGNASGIVDGGAALILSSEAAAKDKGLTPLGRLVAWASVGVDPSYMGMGPVPATHKALARAGMTLDQIDLIEVNEAFAGQYLAVEKDLGLDRNKTNVNGGAIALGHPLGMTGTRLLLTLTLELGRQGKKYGLATACIGGGQGIAAIVERF